MADFNLVLDVLAGKEVHFVGGCNRATSSKICPRTISVFNEKDASELRNPAEKTKRLVGNIFYELGCFVTMLSSMIIGSVGFMAPIFLVAGEEAVFGSIVLACGAGIAVGVALIIVGLSYKYFSNASIRETLARFPGQVEELQRNRDELRKAEIAKKLIDCDKTNTCLLNDAQAKKAAEEALTTGTRDSDAKIAELQAESAKIYQSLYTECEKNKGH